MGEEFRAVVGYEGIYEISNIGRVLTLPRLILRSDGVVRKNHGRVRATNLSRWGYERVTLHKNNRHTTISIHILVARAFVPNPNNDPVVNHLDGNKLNNRPENLEWTTLALNIAHACRIGLMPKGEAIHNALLTENGVLEIRHKWAKGKTTQVALGREYGVAYQTIAGAITGRRWGHVLDKGK